MFENDVASANLVVDALAVGWGGSGAVSGILVPLDESGVSSLLKNPQEFFVVLGECVSCICESNLCRLTSP